MLEKIQGGALTASSARAGPATFANHRAGSDPIAVARPQVDDAARPAPTPGGDVDPASTMSWRALSASSAPRVGRDHQLRGKSQKPIPRRAPSDQPFHDERVDHFEGGVSVFENIAASAIMRAFYAR